MLRVSGSRDVPKQLPGQTSKVGHLGRETLDAFRVADDLGSLGRVRLCFRGGFGLLPCKFDGGLLLRPYLVCLHVAPEGAEQAGRLELGREKEIQRLR